MNRILIATDGSPSATEAIELGVELATEQSAAVSLVHVIPKSEVHRGVVFEHPEQDEVLREGAAELRKADIDPELKLLSGDAATEISWLAEKLDVDVVVIGSRGRGKVQGALLGSVSRRVLANCDRPVIVVRHANVTAAA